MKQIQFTQEGLEKFKKEYEELQQQRPDAVDHLKRARELGDLSENGYYKASRARLSFIDGRLFQLKNILKSAVVVAAHQSELVEIGCTVTLDNGKVKREYMIVGDYEANPSEGKISSRSPLGKSLIGKHMGEKITVHAPARDVEYTIAQITS